MPCGLCTKFFALIRLTPFDREVRFLLKSETLSKTKIERHFLHVILNGKNKKETLSPFY